MQTRSSHLLPQMLGFVGLLALIPLICTGAGGEDRYEMITYMHPGAASTVFRDIGNDGTIVGMYTLSGADQFSKGLILGRRQTESVEWPQRGNVELSSIRANHWSLGTFQAGDFSVLSGFLRNPQGVITPLPEAGPDISSVVPTAMNDHGIIVGGAFGEFDGQSGSRAFILEQGEYSFYTYPATNLLYLYFTGVNNAGRIVGYWVDTDSRYHGFKFHKGRFTNFDLPGSDVTLPLAINNQRQIAGTYIASGSPRGFLDDDGTVTRFDYQGQGQTAVYGLNDRGELVGTAFNAAGAKGLLIVPARPPNGK